MHGSTSYLSNISFPYYTVLDSKDPYALVPPPRCYEPIRYFRTASPRWMLNAMIVRYFDTKDKHRVITQWQTLPAPIIQMLYEHGLLIILVNQKFADKGEIPWNGKILSYRLETIFGVKQTGVYLPSERIMILHWKSLESKEHYIPYYLMAQCIQNAILNNPKISDMRVDQIIPNSYLALPHIIDVCIQKSKTHFFQQFHDFFFLPNRESLKESDRLIHHLFTSWESMLRGNYTKTFL